MFPAMVNVSNDDFGFSMILLHHTRLWTFWPMLWICICRFVEVLPKIGTYMYIQMYPHTLKYVDRQTDRHSDR